MSNLLNEDVKGQIQEAFKGLKEPTHVLFFGTTEECQFCTETLQLDSEVTEL